MLKNTKYYLFFAVILLAVINTMTSCTPSKKVIYFNDLNKDSASGTLGPAQIDFENIIQKNDLLSITVGGSNTADLLVLNSANGTAAGGTSEAATGYLVEADGKIKIPYIGKVQAEGINRLQLETNLTELFKEYTKNPVVNVRFLNYKFSVIGEVKSPGRFTMANERTTILEAITQGGDLTELGKRENILVIREVNGVRKYGRVNLISQDLFKSPYYYLKTNDVVYVEPVKSKFISRSGIPQYLSLITTGLALLLTVIAFKK